MPRRIRTSSMELARQAADAEALLFEASRSLHDQAGPLLAAAGLHLDLLVQDHPEAAASARETGAILNLAMDSVRALSQRLDPSPVTRGGLKLALSQLCKRGVTLDYRASGKPPLLQAEALYHAVAQTVEAASRRKGIAIRVRGTSNLSVRIELSGPVSEWRRTLEAAQLLARARGLKFDLRAAHINVTRKGTIVVIHYARRRPSSG